ncbi:MAG: HU family DNA-binding protein [Planctomycetota bacterium]
MTDINFKTITRRMFVDRCSAKLLLPASTIDRYLRHFFATVSDHLADGHRVELRDFGIFESRVRPARRILNPITGQRLNTPDRRFVRFKPGRLLKSALADISIPNNSQNSDSGKFNNSQV